MNADEELDDIAAAEAVVVNKDKVRGDDLDQLQESLRCTSVCFPLLASVA